MCQKNSCFITTFDRYKTIKNKIKLILKINVLLTFALQPTIPMTPQTNVFRY